MRLYCVVGMHRSGTSLATRVMNLLGMELGPSSELTAPRADNPRGFWENDRITLFNDRLLATLGGTWSCPPGLDPGWADQPRLEPFVRDARELIGTRFDGAPLAGFKDPRCSLLLPLWQRALPFAGSVLSLRDPRSVAASLERRDGLGAERSAELWLRYVVAAQRADPNQLIVDYDDFFEALEPTLERLTAFLGVAPPEPEQRAAIDDFIALELRHGPAGAPVDGPLMRAACRLHQRLRGFDRADHAAWLDEAASLLPVPSADPRGLSEALAFQLDRLRASTIERDDLVRQRDIALAQRKELLDHRDDLICQRDAAIAQRDELAAHRDDLICQRDAVIAQRDELAAHRDDLIRQRDVAIAQRDELAAHRDDLIRQRDVAIAQRDELKEQIDGQSHESPSGTQASSPSSGGDPAASA